MKFNPLKIICFYELDIFFTPILFREMKKIMKGSRNSKEIHYGIIFLAIIIGIHEGLTEISKYVITKAIDIHFT